MVEGLDRRGIGWESPEIVGVGWPPACVSATGGAGTAT